jgi:ABC-2 type transport system ATP-binding protein
VPSLADTITTDAPILLQTAGISAGYGRTVVLREPGITLRAGEWLGLLGANGSGKSTLLRAITGQIPLQSGDITLAGTALGSAPERAKAAFGYAVDPSELPRGLTGRQYIRLTASIRGCHPAAWPHDDLPGLLALVPHLDKPMHSCSLGTQGKIAIAAALLGAPPLLILDEALNGLDPLVSIRLRRLLRAMTKTGRHAIILATHSLEQVAQDATTVLLLDDGAIKHSWTGADLAAARATPGGLEAAFMRAMGQN